jgi:dTDP-4-amino-4,6-dideoxygalactose transaminase
MKIPFFPYERVYESKKAKFDEIILDVLGRSEFIMRDELERCEKSLADYIGCKHVLGVANGTDAIWLGFLAMQLKAGDEIIMSDHTYVATAGASLLLGLKPVPCGIDQRNLLDPTDLVSKISKRTKAVIVSQINGTVANMTEIQKVCDEHGLILCEDSAQGLGAKRFGKSAGTFGSFGTLSFFPAKVLGCFGDGGAIFTDDDDLYDSLVKLRDHGRDKSGRVNGFGINSRLDNVQAAIIDYKLSYFDECVDRRREVASRYDKILMNRNDFALPILLSQESSGERFTYQNYEFKVDNRDNFETYLNKNGISTLRQWGGKGLSQQDNLLDVDYDIESAEIFFNQSIMLPMNEYLTDEEVEFICEKIKNY